MNKILKILSILSRHAMILICALGLFACGPSEQLTVPTIIPLAPEETDAPSQPASELRFWEPASGELTAPGQVDRWRFSALAGDDVRLQVLGPGLSLVLTLIGPDGAQIDEAATIQAILPQDGRYDVLVQANTEDLGSYQLGLRYADAAAPTPTDPEVPQPIVGVPTPLPISADLGTFIAELSSGETVGEIFNADDADHIYTFRGAAGQYVSIEMNRVSGEIDPVLTLYDPMGNPIALDADSGPNGNALLRNIRLSDDGIYSMQGSNGGQAGGYSLQYLIADNPSAVTPTIIITPTLTPVPPVLTPTIAPASDDRLQDHMPVSGELAEPDNLATHSFLAAAGEILTVGVAPIGESSLIPRVEIIDPNGVPVAATSGDTGPDNRIALIPDLVAALDGPYSIFVTAQGDSFGEYLVAYGSGSTWREIRRGEAMLDRSNTGVFEARGLREVWYVYLHAGDIISASVSNVDGPLRPVLEIVNEAGTLLGIDSNSGGQGRPEINGVRIPASGYYFFRVRGVQPDNLGPYALVWRYVDLAPSPTPPEGSVSILALADLVEDSAYNFYPFQGRAGQRIRVSVAAAPDTALDPVAALLGPDAQVLIEVDDTAGQLNPRFVVTLPDDGTYNVRVNGYLSAGEFTLLVEELF